jgi:hypothetical protein
MASFQSLFLCVFSTLREMYIYTRIFPKIS